MTGQAGFRSAWLSLGANLGDREGAIRTALARLAATPGIDIAAVSDLYETEPWGDADQDAFVNAAAALETTLAPYALLDACGAVEVAGGRMPGRRWGPRAIDVDIVAYEGIGLADARLVLPHPRWRERAFVLVPLAEIAPDLVVDGVRVADALREIGSAGVRRMNAGAG